MPNDIDQLIKKMKDKWPSAMFAREKTDLFTGGMISPKTMANLPWKGEGPPVIRTSGKTGYSVDEFCIWFASKLNQKRRNRHKK